jgi:hypothetical protein
MKPKKPMRCSVSFKTKICLSLLILGSSIATSVAMGNYCSTRNVKVRNFMTTDEGCKRVPITLPMDVCGGKRLCYANGETTVNIAGCTNPDGSLRTIGYSRFECKVVRTSMPGSANPPVKIDVFYEPGSPSPAECILTAQTSTLPAACRDSNNIIQSSIREQQSRPTTRSLPLPQPGAR